jgi:type I restriction enzyme S subunit
VALAGHGDAGCIASHRYPIFRGQPGVAEPAYLLAFLKTDIGKLLLDQHSRGAAGRNRPLNVRTLMKEKVPTPPLPIQRRVCAIVDREARLSRAVASTTTMLREYRARMIADIVTGKLDVREAAAQLQDEVEETEPEGAWVLDEMTDDEAEDAGSELEVAEP